MQHLVRSLRQFGRGEISPRLQQFQNPRRCLLPCDHGFAVPGANTVPLGEVDAVLQKPHGVLAAFIFDAAPIFCAKLPTQKRYIFLFRMLPHIEHRNAFGAAGFVSGCVKRLVDDLLRHRAGRGQNAGGRIWRSLVHRGVAAHVEQGKLLCDDWGILQAQLDFILAALNQALGHFGDDRP